MLIGYVELFKDPNGNDLALLSRRIESRSASNKVRRINPIDVDHPEEDEA